MIVFSLLIGVFFSLDISSYATEATNELPIVAIVTEGNGPFAIGDPIAISLDPWPESLKGKQVELVPQEEKKNWVDYGWGVAEGREGAILLVPLRSGDLPFPAAALREKGAKALSARTAVFTAKIQGEEANPGSKPNDLKPPARLEWPWEFKLLAVVALFSAVLLIVLLVRSAIRSIRARVRKGAQGASLLSEDEEALKALVELRRGGWIAQAKFKQHAYRVSEILKHYVSRRFDFDATESTTEELIDQLERVFSGDQAKNLDWIERIFSQLDRVKFTDYRPATGELERTTDDVEAWVRATKRIAVAAPQAEGAS